MSKIYIFSKFRSTYRKILPKKIRNFIWQNFTKFFVDDDIFYLPNYLSNIKYFPSEIKSHLKKYLYSLSRYSYYAGKEQIVTTINTGQFIVVRRDDNSLTPRIMLLGYWEKLITDYSERLVKIYSSPTIFDVGANFGWYGLTLSRFSNESTIHYFEANNSLIDCIKRTTAINNLTHKSIINHNAVSDINGEILKLNILDHLQGSSSIEDLSKLPSNFSFNDIKEPISMEVESITIDEYSSKHDVKKIDFLKIDVEGHEENVLEGAKRMLAESKDMTLLLEWNTNRYSDNMIKNLTGFEVLILIFDSQALNCKGLHKLCNSTHEFENKLKKFTNKVEGHFDLIFTSNKMLNKSKIKTKFIPSL